MPRECDACTQSGPNAPFRERIVREAGWRVAHDFNSSLEGWLILAPLRHVRALDERTTRAPGRDRPGQILAASSPPQTWNSTR
jgi:hypothetical protein